MPRMHHDSLIVRMLFHPQIATDLPLEDWSILIRQARRSGLLARVADVLDKQHLLDCVPPKPRAHLMWERAIAQRHALAVKAELAHIQRALGPLGIPVILLKGAAYAAADLPPASGRLFSDVDILVPKESLDAVEAALLMHGWADIHTDAYDDRYYRTWMHELPPMQHVKRMTVIDVHHAIVPQTASVWPDPVKLRARARPISESGTFLILSPEDMVLHSAVHLFHDGEFDRGLRDLLDIDMLLRRFGETPSFWTNLVDRAVELQLSRPLFYALRYAHRFIGTPVPESVIAAVNAARPNGIVLLIMDVLLRHAILQSRPWNRHWQVSLAHMLLYIRGNALRMPPLMLARHLFHKAFLSPDKS